MDYNSLTNLSPNYLFCQDQHLKFELPNRENQQLYINLYHRQINECLNVFMNYVIYVQYK